jgi:hypothetical protein
VGLGKAEPDDGYILSKSKNQAKFPAGKIKWGTALLHITPLVVVADCTLSFAPSSTALIAV